MHCCIYILWSMHLALMVCRFQRRILIEVVQIDSVQLDHPNFKIDDQRELVEDVEVLASRSGQRFGTFLTFPFLIIASSRSS